jgi:mannose-6-phosphate isomerase-like protein (cupin superfamily)
MRMRTAGCIALLSCAIAPVARAQRAGANATSPRRLVEAYYRAYEAVDTAAMYAMFHDSLRFEDPGIQLDARSKREFTEGIRRYLLANRVTDITWDIHRRAFDGDWAVVEGTLRMTVNGVPPRQPTRFTTLMRFAGGKIVHQIDYIDYTSMRRDQHADGWQVIDGMYAAADALTRGDTAAVDRFAGYYADTATYEDPTLGVVAAGRSRIRAAYADAFLPGEWRDLKHTIAHRAVQGGWYVVEGTIAAVRRDRPFTARFTAWHRVAGGAIVHQIDYVDYRWLTSANNPGPPSHKTP